MTDHEPLERIAKRRDTPVLNPEPVNARISTDYSTFGLFAKGTLVDDRFRVVSLLGTGGMGAVYLVEHIKTQQKFALKTMNGGNFSDKAWLRFQNEARTTSILSHSGLARFYELGVINGVQPYYVMDYCPGVNLSDLIRENGPLPQSQAVGLFIQLCFTMAYAHSQGIIHRDLKPGNIIVSKVNGKKQSRIVDFGIAKVYRDETEFNTITQTGEIFGSPLYMSPEQCMGHKIDARSDIYSLGCVLFETLTGNPPFLSDNALATMLMHQQDEIPPLRQASDRSAFDENIEAVVRKMLAKEPALRYQSALEVADDLQTIERGKTLSHVAKAATAKRRKIAKPIVFTGISLLVVLLFLFFIPKFLKNADAPKLVRDSTFGFATGSTADHAAKPVVVGKPKFFSKAGTKKQRVFHFPSRSIGLVTLLSNNTHQEFQAAGVRVLNVPFALTSLEYNNMYFLQNFRDDEVCMLDIRSPALDDQSLKLISNYNALSSLNITGSDVTDKSIAFLNHSLPKLEHFYVSDTGITTSGMQRLRPAFWQKVSALGMNRFSNAGIILPLLEGNRNFEELSIVKTQLTDEQLKVLGNVPNIKWLDIRDNLVTDSGLEDIRNLPLLALRVRGNSLTPKSLKTLVKFSKLQILDVSYETWPKADKSELEAFCKRIGCRLYRAAPHEPTTVSGNQ